MRLVVYLGKHPKILRSDADTVITNAHVDKLLQDNYVTYVNHIVCDTEHHHSIGPSENAVGTFRNAAKALLLHANVPEQFWPFAVSHASYLNNLTSRSRCNPKITIFEALFKKPADVCQIPPFGSFATTYKSRRQLLDQSFGFACHQGTFIGIARFKKILGYCITTNGKQIHVTRDHISFDPYLYPFKQRPSTSPAWSTFHQLTNSSASRQGDSDGWGKTNTNTGAR